jgi:dolichol-phosphate mannosyltransferase
VKVDHAQNRGYGAATRTGTLEAAKRGFEYVLYMDSDLTNDPSYIGAFAEAMAEGFDVIKGSRYIRGGGTAGVPAGHVLLSRAGNRIARLLFGLPVHDSTNGFRAVRAKLLVSIDLQENGFALIMEELHRLRPLACSYAEIPIVLKTRSADLRRSSFSFGLKAMARYLKYPLSSAVDRIAHR